MKKKLVLLLVSMSLCLAILEVLLGYKAYLNRYNPDGPNTFPAILTSHHAIRSIKWHVRTLIGGHEVQEPTYLTDPGGPPASPWPEVKDIDQEENPFLPGGSIGLRPHPFIDFTHVHARDLTVPSGRLRDDLELDYFGFRNKEDLYFDYRKGPDDVLILFTGGSEMAGYSHQVTIPEKVATILNKPAGGKTYRVLNLAMNSYTIPNEISAYVHLAYHLQPDFVISHSGVNDMYYGALAPGGFKRLGLTYLPSQARWFGRAFSNEYIREKTVIDMSTREGNGLLVDSYLKSVEKYNTIVSSNGGRLILGVQPLSRLVKDDQFASFHFDILRLNRELISNARRRGYLIFNDYEEIEFVDTIHTTETGGLRTAEIYAQRILQLSSSD